MQKLTNAGNSKKLVFSQISIDNSSELRKKPLKWSSPKESCGKICLIVFLPQPGHLIFPQLGESNFHFQLHSNFPLQQGSHLYLQLHTAKKALCCSLAKGKSISDKAEQHCKCLTGYKPGANIALSKVFAPDPSADVVSDDLDVAGAAPILDGAGSFDRAQTRVRHSVFPAGIGS